MTPRPPITRDPVAGLAVLAFLAVGWLSLFDTFDLVAGLGLLAVLVMPFAILGTAIVREIRKPPQSEARTDERRDDA